MAMTETEAKKLQSDLQTIRTLLDDVSGAVERLLTEIEDRKASEAQLLSQQQEPGDETTSADLERNAEATEGQRESRTSVLNKEQFGEPQTGEQIERKDRPKK